MKHDFRRKRLFILSWMRWRILHARSFLPIWKPVRIICRRPRPQMQVLPRTQGYAEITHEIAKAEQCSHIREMTTQHIRSSSTARCWAKENVGRKGGKVQVNDLASSSSPAKSGTLVYFCPYLPYLKLCMCLFILSVGRTTPRIL